MGATSFSGVLLAPSHGNLTFARIFRLDVEMLTRSLSLLGLCSLPRLGSFRTTVICYAENDDRYELPTLSRLAFDDVSLILHASEPFVLKSYLQSN